MLLLWLSAATHFSTNFGFGRRVIGRFFLLAGHRNALCDYLLVLGDVPSEGFFRQRSQKRVLRFILVLGDVPSEGFFRQRSQNALCDSFWLCTTYHRKVFLPEVANTRFGTKFCFVQRAIGRFFFCQKVPKRVLRLNLVLRNVPSEGLSVRRYQNALCD